MIKLDEGKGINRRSNYKRVRKWIENVHAYYAQLDIRLNSFTISDSNRRIVIDNDFNYEFDSANEKMYFINIIKKAIKYLDAYILQVFKSTLTHKGITYDLVPDADIAKLDSIEIYNEDNYKLAILKVIENGKAASPIRARGLIESKIEPMVSDKLDSSTNNSKVNHLMYIINQEFTHLLKDTSYALVVKHAATLLASELLQIHTNTIDTDIDLLLNSKKDEYSTEDRFYTFRTQVFGYSEQESLKAYCLKHIMSMNKIIANKDYSNKELIKEKLYDIIAYMKLFIMLDKDFNSRIEAELNKIGKVE